MKKLNINSRQGILLLSIAAFACLFLPFKPALAIATGDNKAITFHGTLRVHQCHINNDRDINVHFDKVGVHKVDGVRYKQQIPWQLVCDASDPSWRLTLILKGNATTFDNAALTTSASGLGIRILQNGQPFEINKAIDIQSGNLPTLEVVPIKNPNAADLQAGAFNATATLLAEYL
ncbi:fimbrial protein [Salmonella enterica]